MLMAQHHDDDDESNLQAMRKNKYPLHMYSRLIVYLCEMNKKIGLIFLEEDRHLNISHRLSSINKWPYTVQLSQVVISLLFFQQLTG